MSIKKLSLVTAVAVSLAAPIAQADAGVGAGITYVFGKGVAVGLKLFTNDEEDKAVGSVGLDYVIKSGAWRPNVGVGYLGDNIYGDVNAGYNYKTGEWDFGIGVGATDTEDDKRDPAPTPESDPYLT